MKKFFAFLLTFAMLFSLAMPAMAAEITGESNTDNPAVGNVSASYTPSSTEDTTAKITGLYITVDGVKYESSTAEAPVTIYSDSTVTVTVYGENFANLPVYGNHTSAFTYFGSNSVYLFENGSEWSIDPVSNTATYTANHEILARATAASELKYTNDRNATELGSGVYVIYNEGTKPTYYNITVSETENGTVTASKSAAAEGDSITLTVTPAEGYLLGKLTVTNAATSEVTDITDSKTFEMPGSDVTVKAVFEKIPHAITIDENIANGTVTADLEFAVEGSIVTLTVTPNTGYQIGAVTVKDADDKTVDFTETGVASGVYTFKMPASAVTVTATFEAIPITSADITWGSMSFTYDDTIDETTNAEKGWSDSDTGWVTVKNTGNTTFTAQASYESTTEEYGTITGSFDPASYELTAGSSYTFTLELNGKPTKAIPAGTKIGQVTITINESAEG